MENQIASLPTPSSSKRSRRNILLTISLLLIAGIIGGTWYYLSTSVEQEIKFAFAPNHEFRSPALFFTGRMTFEIDPFDRRMIKLKIDSRDIEFPKPLIVEDGELDFIGTVRRDVMFVPLELYQIHNDRTGEPRTSPVSNCRTYLEFPADADTVLVVVDGKYLLKGTRIGYHRYVIPFCETTRDHTFRVLDAYGQEHEPMVYAYNGRINRGATLMPQPQGGRISPRTVDPGQLDKTSIGSLSPQVYSRNDAPAPRNIARIEGLNNKSTKVVITLPRRLENPWVYVNDKRQRDYNTEDNGMRIVFWTKRNNQPITVRLGDANCECEASGRADRPLLELSAVCACRDVLVYLNLDKGLDRYRNKIQVYVDGQLTGLPIPPAGQPLVLALRKIGRPQNVEIKLALPDDTGRLGLFDVCEFIIPSEPTTIVLNPPCYCPTCPPNVKISG
ncbi:MAG: hypothetical protein NZM43_08380 [Saprospiraceae bacterium]|nr:hypothetical protein [Saprospiraceae bacterium]MDW8484326.1 hypothetical protein [Saprospiraceae bacterium]